MIARVVISGEDITEADAREVGEAYAKLLNAAHAQAMNATKTLGIEVGGVQWMCDGCEILRPEKPADWVNLFGLDYCRDCHRELGS